MVELLKEHYENEELERRMTADFGVKRIRTYNEHDDRVTDDEYGMQYSYRHTVGKGDISNIIEDRRKKMLLLDD
jgi:protein subunit release factor A